MRCSLVAYHHTPFNYRVAQKSNVAERVNFRGSAIVI
jgi:hypothetical protein